MPFWYAGTFGVDSFSAAQFKTVAKKYANGRESSAYRAGFREQAQLTNRTASKMAYTKMAYCHKQLLMLQRN